MHLIVKPSLVVAFTQVIQFVSINDVTIPLFVTFNALELELSQVKSVISFFPTRPFNCIDSPWNKVTANSDNSKCFGIFFSIGKPLFHSGSVSHKSSFN